MWIESNNILYGRTANPYDISRTPGGSSGGEVCVCIYLVVLYRVRAGLIVSCLHISINPTFPWTYVTWTYAVTTSQQHSRKIRKSRCLKDTKKYSVCVCVCLFVMINLLRWLWCNWQSVVGSREPRGTEITSIPPGLSCMTCMWRRWGMLYYIHVSSRVPYWLLVALHFPSGLTWLGR